MINNNEDYISSSSTPTTVATSPDCDDYLVLCHAPQPLYHQHHQPCYYLVPTPGPAGHENNNADAVWPSSSSSSSYPAALMNPSMAEAAATSTVGAPSITTSECDCCRPSTSTDFKPSFYNPFEVKHRRRTSRAQFKVLERTFEETPKPNAQKRRALAQKLGMTPRGVQVWFQNRRAKAKAQLRREQQQNHLLRQGDLEEEEEEGDEEQQQHYHHDSGMMGVEDTMHHRLTSVVTAAPPPPPPPPAITLSSIEPITPPFPMDPFWVDESCKSMQQQRSFNVWEEECCWVAMDAMSSAAAFDTLFPLQSQPSSTVMNNGLYISHPNELRRSASFPQLVAPMEAFNEDQRRLSEPTFNTPDLDLALLNCVPPYYGGFA